MAVTKVGSSLAQISNATSATLAKPAGVAAGDLIVILYGGDNDGGAAAGRSGVSNAALTPPAGFTSYHYQCGSGDNWLEWVMYRVADGTEASTFTPSTASQISDGGAVCIVYRGVDTANPFIACSPDGSTNATSNAFQASNSAGRSEVAFVGALVNQAGSASITWPSGWDTSTQGAGGTGSSSGGMTLYVAGNLTTTSGFIPGGTVTLAASNWLVSNTYLLRVAGGPAATTDVVQAHFEEGSPGTFTLNLPTRAGNTIAIGLQGFGQSGGSNVPQFTSVSDGRHTLTPAPSTDAQSTSPNYGVHTVWYYVEDCLAGTESVTVATDIGTYFRITILELGPSHYDNSNGAHATPTLPADLTAGSITPTAANGLAAVLVCQDGQGSPAWAPTAAWAVFVQDAAGAGGTYSAVSLLGTPAAAVDMGVLFSGPTGTTTYAASGVTFIPKGGAATPVALTATTAAASVATVGATAASRLTPVAAAVSVSAATATAPVKLTPTAVVASASTAAAVALVKLALSAAAVTATSVVESAAAVLSSSVQATSAASVAMGAPAVLSASAHATSAAVASASSSTVPLLAASAQATGVASAVLGASTGLAATAGAQAQAIAVVATPALLSPHAAATARAAGLVVTVLAYTFVTSASMTFTLVTTESA